jgi:hypothetical protein
LLLAPVLQDGSPRSGNGVETVQLGRRCPEFLAEGTVGRVRLFGAAVRRTARKRARDPADLRGGVPPGRMAAVTANVEDGAFVALDPEALITSLLN